MKKTLLAILAACASLFMVTSCDGLFDGEDESYSIKNAPSWLQGSWIDPSGIFTVEVEKDKFSMMGYDWASDELIDAVSNVKGSDTEFSFDVGDATTETYTFKKKGVDITVQIDEDVLTLSRMPTIDKAPSWMYGIWGNTTKDAELNVSEGKFSWGDSGYKIDYTQSAYKKNTSNVKGCLLYFQFDYKAAGGTFTYKFTNEESGILFEKLDSDGTKLNSYLLEKEHPLKQTPEWLLGSWAQYKDETHLYINNGNFNVFGMSQNFASSEYASKITIKTLTDTVFEITIIYEEMAYNPETDDYDIPNEFTMTLKFTKPGAHSDGDYYADYLLVEELYTSTLDPEPHDSYDYFEKI